MIAAHVRPGITTGEIDRLCHDFMRRPRRRARHARLPRLHQSSCTSINHVVCHGIPGERPLREGDIVNIDVTLILDGWHGDTSRMFVVGEINQGGAADRRDL
jgi:methionyl aminopeptidase